MTEQNLIRLVTRISASSERMTVMYINKSYSEKEVNERLSSIYADFAILRRYLVNSHLLERSNDCREYWVNEELAKNKK